MVNLLTYNCIVRYPTKVVSMIGVDSWHSSSLNEELQNAKSESADFIVTALFHPRNNRNARTAETLQDFPLTRSDMIFGNKDWSSNIVGKLSCWIDLDNENAKIRINSEEILVKEISWALHIGVQAILLPAPTLNCLNYSRVLKTAVQSIQYQQLWIQIPLVLEMHYRSSSSNNSTDGWLLWDNVRHSISHNPHIFIALELNQLPDDFTTDDEYKNKFISNMNRWRGESTRCFIIHTKHFIKNKNSYPVLPKIWQNIIILLFKINSNINIIIKGKPIISNALSNYISYIKYLRNQNLESKSDYEKSFSSYYDVMQSPLQPLADNLESGTYETFEKDIPKYNQYTYAIQKAFIDLNSTEIKNDILIVYVVGAGRGPLIKCAMDASKLVGVNIKVYAIEKNENAVITLRNRLISDNWNNVTIINSDMRLWTPDELAHVIISELLGSWGDNELSPECLNSVTLFLRPHGIMIPSSYTSYIAPITASRVWMGCRDMSSGKGLESPYVVKLHAYDQLSTAKPLFTFTHPSSDNEHRRFSSTSFTITKSSTMHGIAGTFFSTLYSDISLSTVPDNHTHEMFSWFPLFIPLQTPLSLKESDIVTICIWRCVDSKKVWYEWCLSSPVITHIQNSRGNSYNIGL